MRDTFFGTNPVAPDGSITDIDTARALDDHEREGVSKGLGVGIDALSKILNATGAVKPPQQPARAALPPQRFSPAAPSNLSRYAIYAGVGLGGVAVLLLAYMAFKPKR